MKIKLDIAGEKPIYRKYEKEGSSAIEIAIRCPICLSNDVSSVESYEMGGDMEVMKCGMCGLAFLLFLKDVINYTEVANNLDREGRSAAERYVIKMEREQ